MAWCLPERSRGARVKLARVLEPWLYYQEGGMLEQSREETRPWERRFLD